MQKNLLEDLQNELEPIFKFSEKLREEQDGIITFIKIMIDKMYEAINALENISDPQIKRIADIKKNKSYLERYIDSFELNGQYYHAIGDTEQMEFMYQSWKTFKAFKESSELVLNSFAEVNTYMLSIPDIKIAIRLLKERKRLTPKQKQTIQQYNIYKNAQKISKFFEGYNVTRKGIITSISIHLFRSLSILKIPKHTLKDVIESIFACLDETVKVYPDNMQGVYIKTMFKEIPIFAYPSKNEKASYYDLNKVTESLEKRIQSKLEDGKIRESDRLKKYFENIILPLKQRVNPSSSS